jgi:hypothetical protein
MMIVRAYLPTTLPQLAARLSVDAHTGRVADPTVPVADAGAVAFAVTPALREWYREGDAEELEYAAYTRAAHAGLRLLAQAARDGAASAPRRVVLALEVAGDGVTPLPDADAAAVRLLGPVAFDRVVSAHVDDPAAGADVAAAMAAIEAAAAGDDDAQFTVDAVDDHELAWYAAEEIGFLLS